MICYLRFRELFCHKKLRGAQWHSRGQRFDPAYLHHQRRVRRIRESPKSERIWDFFLTFRPILILAEIPI